MWVLDQGIAAVVAQPATAIRLTEPQCMQTMMADSGTGSANSHVLRSSQWDIWFRTNSRVLREIQPADATPESALNDNYTYVLKPGFSLLPAKEMAPGEEQRAEPPTEQVVAHEDNTEGRTVKAEVRKHCKHQQITCEYSPSTVVPRQFPQKNRNRNQKDVPAAGLHPA